ncbi:MAG: hypothetical protein NAOJABEB_01197 [Steroidobacteraceae bacterium]|nr:hypothetical protein [Steroidobacteraceae bacterium]
MSIDSTEALMVAQSHLIAEFTRQVAEVWPTATVTDNCPRGIYRTWEEAAWYVWVPPQVDGGPWPALRSSKVIVVSKASGRVMTMTSANDEG